MKIKSIKIKNIGIIARIVIEINKPLNLIVGDVEQGKTTILDSVKYCLGAKYPSDILRHGTDEGHILIKYDNSSLKRIFRRKKDGTVTADKIQFILNGEVRKKPIDAIKEFLNPFLLDQYFFSKKSELERSKYFLDLFDVDVCGIDAEIKDNEKVAHDLRIEIKTYGFIDINPVEPADVYALTKERQSIISEYQKNRLKRENENESAKRCNSLIEKYNTRLKEIGKEKEVAERKLRELDHELIKVCDWIKKNPKVDILPEISLPNTEGVDKKISDAKAQNERSKRYLENKSRYDEKQRKNIKLSEKESLLRELRLNKIKKLACITDNCGVKGLKFDDSANGIYEDTTLGMLSTSQVMRLSSALSALYPKGFGVELLDGAERLGWTRSDLTDTESIQIYIDKANQNESTILATIVGEEPAKVPGGVGVWVIKKGKLKDNHKN